MKNILKNIWGKPVPDNRYEQGLLASTDPSKVSPRVAVILGCPEGSKVFAEAARQAKRGQKAELILPQKTQERLYRAFGDDYKPS